MRLVHWTAVSNLFVNRSYRAQLCGRSDRGPHRMRFVLVVPFEWRATADGVLLFRS